ncbi:MAG: DNA gyrase inhibitor YacG [Brachymonas sp.]|nr:DNA gyrase inhibitor YacG [Brachymonas sp.]
MSSSPTFSSRKPRTVPCPQCGADSVFDATLNPHRPFCSQRCKQIDLGAWSSESYRMPQPLENPMSDDAPLPLPSEPQHDD